MIVYSYYPFYFIFQICFGYSDIHALTIHKLSCLIDVQHYPGLLTIHKVSRWAYLKVYLQGSKISVGFTIKQVGTCPTRVEQQVCFIQHYRVSDKQGRSTSSWKMIGQIGADGQS